MADDYEVGYGKPPKKHRFKKGRSGNLQGRPPNKKSRSIDVAEVLLGPVTVRKNGKSTTMSAFEVRIRKLAERAIKKLHVNSAIEFLKLCERYGVFDNARPPQNNVLRIPKDWSRDEWFAMLYKHGAPPWPGPRTGLTKEDEERYRKNGWL